MHFDLKRVQAELPNYLMDHGIAPNKSIHCLHPEHDDKKPSASMFVSKTGNHLIKCFSCNRTYDIFDVAAYLEGRPDRDSPNWFKDNVLYLARKFNIPIRQPIESPILQIYQEISKYLRPKYSSQTYKELKTNGGLPLEVELTKDDIIEHLASKGFSALDLKSAGVTDSRFSSEYTILPLYTSRDIIVGYKTRREGQKPKYLTTPNNTVFDKSSYLYGLFLDPDKDVDLYVVEGERDCLGLWASGLQAVSTMGSDISEQQLDLLKGFKSIVVCFDGDQAGRRGAFKVCKKFLLRGMLTRICNLPDGEDPLSLIEQEAPLPNPLDSLFHLFTLLGEQQGEEEATITMCKYLASIEGSIKRESIINSFTAYTSFTREALVAEVEEERQRRKNKEEEKIKTIALQAVETVTQAPQGAINALEQAIHDVRDVTSIGQNKGSQKALNVLEEIEQGQENLDEKEVVLASNGLRLIQDYLSDGLGWWGSLNLISADEHQGKSTILNNLVIQALKYNNDVRAILLLTDDDVPTTIPKFIAGIVHNPNFSIRDGVSFSHSTDARTREEGKKASDTLKEWLEEERLIMIDSSETRSVAAMESKINYLRKRYGDQRILLCVDSLHRVSDGRGSDENTAQDVVTSLAKGMATRLGLSVWATVEMKKMKSYMWTRSSDDISGSRSQKYAATTIWLLYSDGAQYNNVLENSAYRHEYKGTFYPRIKLILAKNKISGKLGEIYLDMFPLSHIFMDVDQDEARREVGRRIHKIIEEKKLKSEES